MVILLVQHNAEMSTDATATQGHWCTLHRPSSKS